MLQVWLYSNERKGNSREGKTTLYWSRLCTEKESPGNEPGADLILHQEATNCVVVVEVKGENPSQINGLGDVQKALGQIIEHIDNPQGTNADTLEDLAVSGATFIFAIAVPYTQRYLKWCNERVSQSIRKKLNLYWLFVERNGQMNIVGPLDTPLTIQTTTSHKTL